MAGELPDYLRPGLSVVLVGFNPGLTSGRLGHYYAAPQNRFWRLLYEGGLVPVPLSCEEDHRVLEYGIGLTDIVKRMSSGSQDLSPAELREGAARLREKLHRMRPSVAAFLGKGVFRAFAGTRDARYGPVDGDLLPGVRGFVSPSPSGRSGLPYREKLARYRELAAFIRDVKGREEGGAPHGGLSRPGGEG